MASRRTLDVAWNAMIGEFRYTKGSENALEEEFAKDKSRWQADRLRNETSTEPYKYTALAESETSAVNAVNATRLLELLPGSRQDDIRCRLIRTDLEGCEKTYEALSYVWGTQQEATPIQIDDATLLIGMNLRSALLNLRRTDRSRILWVDAVCINQQDVDEKAQQVANMGTIYRSAWQVVVWLGDANRYTKEVFNNLTMLDNGRRMLSEGGGEMDKPLRSKLYETLKGDNAIEHMLELSWWFRAWTAQEIILAADAIITWGPYQIGWDVLVGGIEFGKSLGIWKSAGLGVWNSSHFLPLEAVMKLKREPRPLNVADNLLRHLAHSRFRSATNACDKIFSVLGLSEDNSRSFGIEPNYRLPTTVIYRDAAVRFVTVAGNYDILGFCHTAGDGIYASQMPSWVPDWSSTDYIAMPLLTDSLGRPRLTHATGSSRKARPIFRYGDAEKLTIMVTRGQVLDHIDALVAVLGYLDEDEWGEGDTTDEEEEKEEPSWKEVFQELGTDLKSIIHQFGKVVPHLETFVGWEVFVKDVYRNKKKGFRMNSDRKESSTEDTSELYMQTICAGTLAPDGQDETKKLFLSWLDSLSSIRRLKSWKVDRWGALYNPLGFGGTMKNSWNNSGEFTAYLKATYERRLGATKGGRLCLLPKTTEIGDCLAILEGGRVPVVLRSGADGTYRFVGEAYVHDLMDGSAFDETQCSDLPIS